MAGGTWGLAAGAFFYDISILPLGVIGSAGGAIAGIVASVVLIRNEYRSLSAFLRDLLIIAIPLLAAALFLPPLANAVIPLPAKQAFISFNILTLFFLSCGLAFTLRSLSSCFRWFVALEALFVMLALGQFMAAHRGGNVSQPAWLVDIFIEKGQPLLMPFWITGAAAALFLTAILFGCSHSTSASQRIRRSIFLPALVSLATCVLALIIALRFLRQPPLKPNQPPPPPEISLPDSPPPPPPQPVGLVKFSSLYVPPKRLKNYYFRERVRSCLSGYNLIENTNEPLPRDTWDSFTEGISSLPLSTGAVSISNQSDILTTIVYLVADLDRPFHLISGFRYESLPERGDQIKRAYRIDSLPPGYGDIEDLDLEFFSVRNPDRQVLGNRSWPDSMWAVYTAAPGEAEFRELAEDSTRGMPSMLRGYQIPRLFKIKEWVDHTYYFSARAGKDSGDKIARDFIFNKCDGGSEQYSVATALLLRAAGIPSRVASGYRYEYQDDVRWAEGVMITDLHADTWPEVYLQGTGWVPVPLNPVPEHVRDANPPPPPQLEEETRMGERLKEAAKAGGDAGWIDIGTRAILLLALAAATGLIILNAWRFNLRPHLCSNDTAYRVCYQTAKELLALTGFRRRFDETENEFASRLTEYARVRRDDRDREVDRRLADIFFAFATLTGMKLDDYATMGTTYAKHSKSEWLAKLGLLSCLVMRKIHIYNPLGWARTHMPREHAMHMSKRRQP